MSNTLPGENAGMVDVFEQRAVWFYTVYDRGETAGLTLAQTRELFVFAGNTYPDVKAHNFEHGVDVLTYGMDLAVSYEAAFPARTQLNRKALIGGLLLHDVSDSEEQSAELFATWANQVGFDSADIEVGRGIILSSKQDVEPVTAEQLIMNIADTHTVGEEADVFEARGKDFLEEKRQSEGQDFDEIKFRVENLLRLSAYIAKISKSIRVLGLGGFEREWMQQAIGNVGRTICNLAEQQFHEDPSSFAQSLDDKQVLYILDSYLPKTSSH